VLVCALSVLMMMWHAIMSWLKSNSRDYVACVVKLTGYKAAARE